MYSPLSLKAGPFFEKDLPPGRRGKTPEATKTAKGKEKSVSEKEPGAMEKAKGMAKEVAGEVIGHEDMRVEGREEREGTEGHRGYFRNLIEKTNERAASGKA
jgi:uncharacterized protein YjbJ (UPF0337 family)